MVKKLASTLNMSKLVVTSDYVTGFHKADNTFLYQLVFDPIKRRLVPLNPYPPEVDPDQMHYAGPYPLQAMIMTMTKFIQNYNAFIGLHSKSYMYMLKRFKDLL